jgi:hypothetical protein
MRVRLVERRGKHHDFEVVSVTLRTESGELWLTCSDGKAAVLTVRNIDIVVEDSFLPPTSADDIRRRMDGSPLVTVN